MATRADGSRTSSPHPPNHEPLTSASSPGLQGSSTLTSPRSSGQSGVNVNFPSPSVSAGAARRTAGARIGLRLGQQQQQHPEAMSSSSSREPSKPASHDGLIPPAADDDYEVWAPTLQSTHVYTPPGAVSELPSMSMASPSSHVRDSTAPWMATSAQHTASDYDWAGFVYAYSRGRWDPTRLPQPPSQSNVHPGAETRIGMRDSVASTSTVRQRSRSPDREPDSAEAEVMRRPSIDYVGAAPGAVQRLLSDPDRRTAAALLSHTPPPPSKPLLGEFRESAHISAALNNNAALKPQKSESEPEEVQSSSKAADNLPQFIDPFKPLATLTMSSSAPDVRHPDIWSSDTSGDPVRRTSGKSAQDPSLQKGSKTDSVVQMRNSDVQLPSDVPTGHLKQFSQQNDTSSTSGGILAAITSPPLDHVSLASAVSAVRPALSAQVSDMTRKASYTSRGNQILNDVSGSAGGSAPPRPRPVPVQADSKSSEAEHEESQNGATAHQAHKDLGKDFDVDGNHRFASKTRAGEISEPTNLSCERVSGGEPQGSAFMTPAIKRTSSGKESVMNSLRAMATVDEDVHSRRASAALPKLPVDLANIGPSHSSPSISTYLGVGRRVETFYREQGYLPAIMPPDEAERRVALRRYGPPRVRGNSNFERIAHLVKLVFNTKIVLISLVGESIQFFQTEVGAQSIGRTSDWLQQVAAPRDCSMCAHAILQPNDEPLVVLDTHRDWRFAGNPLVLDDPKIRFYAGSPLRTSDGFNLGSLCIIDDRPWTEFSPRHRHTLREFARVVMREMELIRDTIHLRTQDRMQHSIELFTRKCIEMESVEGEDEKGHSQGLHQLYDMAAKGMCEALQASGAIVFDLSQFEVVASHSVGDVDEAGDGRIFLPSPHHFVDDSSTDAPPSSDGAATGGSTSPHDTVAISGVNKTAENEYISPMAVLGACELQEPPATRDQNVPASHYVKIAEFLRKHRTGFFYPFTPTPFRHLLPSGMSHVLLVPIFGLNRQPFALLCAYSRDSEEASTLGDIKESGLQYLRAMGTIILSAILKNDIMLADKAKSHFISNISHELRTPLHGILAAAELLAETKLNATQGSYLETVEACGKSLLELVNHVLDFTKLSGNLHANKKAVLKPTQRCDLVKLIQEVCESSWIGQMAKNLDSQKYAGIGSAYAKGSEQSSSVSSSKNDDEDTREIVPSHGLVETVIDVSMRSSGWLVKCDAGGIRRVLMNLIGNSLKFTTKGFVHVSLREVQSTDTHVLVEMGVTDTGKGISRSFLEEQLFHPFTQENHLGPGTGLGLSIVNSIVQSPAINGKIDVWSTVGQGTEIRVTCELELSDANEAEGPTYKPVLNVERQRSVNFVGFDDAMRGQSDLKDVLRSYFEDWWHFKSVDGSGGVEQGDIILVNDDARLIRTILQKRSTPLPPVILLTGARGKPEVTKLCEDYEARGGVVRLLFKPAGPAKLEAVTDFCLQCFYRGQAGLPMLAADSVHSTPLPSPAADQEEKWTKGYFGDGDATTSQRPDFSAEDDAVTPRGPPGEGHGASTLQGPTRPTLQPRVSNELRRNSHHISPGPPSASDAALLRRHSSEDRDGHQQGVSATYVTSTVDGAVHASAGQPSVKGLLSSSNSTGSSRREKHKPTGNRPLMPTRSITYHEPRLQRHVLMSPLRSPHYRRGGGGDGSSTGEPMDYFGPGAAASAAAAAAAGASALKTATATSSTISQSLTPSSISGFTDSSSPASPGSVISLEGGEGAVLRSAVHTAGLVRVGSGGAVSHNNAPGSGIKKRLQVLSVEDNAINRRVLAAFFGKMEVDLVEATNGEEGVRAFEAHPPFHFDVIFMDLSMPVLDGIGAMMQIRKIEADRFRAEHSSTSAWLKAVRSSTHSGSGSGAISTNASKKSTSETSPTSPTSSLSSTSSSATVPTAASIFGTPGGSRPSAQARAKIFALTGRSSDEDKRRVFATGADGFIVKPLSFKVLSSLIHTISAYK